MQTNQFIRSSRKVGVLTLDQEVKHKARRGFSFVTPKDCLRYNSKRKEENSSESLTHKIAPSR